MNKMPTPTEHEEAIILASYLDLLQKTGKIELYSHIAQETFTKSWGTKRRNKAEGVRSGVPDYVVITKGLVIFLELKRVKGSVVSSDQHAWIKGLQGKKTKSKIVYGFNEAKKFLDGLI